MRTINSDRFNKKNFILFSLIMINVLSAQDTKLSIKFTGQITTEENLKKDKSIISMFSDYLFGKMAYELQKPMSLHVNKNSDIWVLDQGKNCIINIKKSTHSFHMVNCEKNLFPSLVGICKVNSDTVLFSDSQLNRLFFFSEADNQIQSFAEHLELNKPTGMAFNPETKDIWIVETGRHRILILKTTGEIKHILGSQGTNQSQFNFPTFIWLDDKGTTYIVDTMNFRIQIFDADGNFISMFGETGNASGYFARPKGIATDSKGNIYIVDALFNAVQIFDKQGNFLYSFGKKGNGPMEFILPTGIYIDDSDRIYVADSYNGRIQIFELNRNMTDNDGIKN